MKKVLSFLAVFSVLIARENPFLPVVKIDQPSEQISEVEFSKMAFSFPKDARKLTRIKLEYLAMDGSIKEYAINVDQPIDWHKIYQIISEEEYEKSCQNVGDIFQKNMQKIREKNEEKFAEKITEQSGEKIGQKNEESAQQNLELDGSLKATIRQPAASEMPDVSHFKVQKKEEKKEGLQISEKDGIEKIKINAQLSLVVQKQSVKVITKSRMIRQFALNKPDRIVLDFSPISRVGAHTFPLLNSSFDSLLIGEHDGFFRVVLHTDSKYDYELSYDDEGCLITLK